jgi:hypothetical protein
MQPEPQLTRWGPADGLPAGITVNGRDNGLIPWSQLELEIKTRVLPQVKELDERWKDVRTAELRGKKDWIIEIVDREGNVIAHVWFGPDPLKSWAYDGLVRVGKPEVPSEVWQVYQRFSDGSYRRSAVLSTEKN